MPGSGLLLPGGPGGFGGGFGPAFGGRKLPQRQFLSRVSISALERPKLALANLIRFDLGGAARSLFAPTTLSPTQRQTIVDQLGIPDTGIVGKVLRIAENPLVLGGLVLGMVFPVPLARNIFKFEKRASGLLRSPGLLRLAVTGNFDAIYAGLKVRGRELPETFRLLQRDVGLFTQRHLERMGRIIQRYESRTGRQFDERLESLLAVALENVKFKKGALSAPFQELVTNTRQVFDTVFREVVETSKTQGFREALQTNKLSTQKFRRLLGLQKAGRASEADIRLIKKVRGEAARNERRIAEMLGNAGFGASGELRAGKLPDYFPHLLDPKALESFDRETKALVAATAGGEKVFGRRMLGGARKFDSPHLKIRREKMLPDPEDLEKVKDLLEDPAMITRVRSRLAEDLPPKTYSLKFLDVFERYTHSMGKAFGWVTQGRGTDLVLAAEALEKTATKVPTNLIRALNLRDAYIPLALGRASFREVVSAAHYDGMRMNLYNALTRTGVPRLLGPRVEEFLKDGLLNDRGVLSSRRIQGRIASNFYVGALGLNVTSSAYNMLQTLLTTAPLLGLKATAKGIGRVLDRGIKYAKARQAGLTGPKALEKAFPEFVGQGLALSPLTEEALGGAFARSWERVGRLKPNVVSETIDKTKGFLMTLFQSSEQFVRLTAFESALGKALAEGETLASASNFAGRATLATQFLSGAEGVPAFAKNLGPLLRQFGTFPARYADFLFGTATEIGSAAQNVLGVNPGTAARAVGYGAAVFEGVKEFLNQDITPGLVFGALPVPQEDQPFFPFPFVPPAVAIPGAAIKDLLSGEFKTLRFQLPIALSQVGLPIPGVALAKASTLLGDRIAPLLGRESTRLDQKLPDGRIPIFARSGSLRGFVTPFQAFANALGIPPGGPGALQAERDLEAFLLGQRDRIRGLHKQFLDALILENDPKKAAKIQAEFERRYPGLGGLKVRKQDIRAVELRAMVPRLEKTLEDLPADVRPVFGQIVSMALMAQAPKLLGVDPLLLQQPTTQTVASRDIYRQPPESNVLLQLFRRRVQQRQVLQPFPATGATQGGRTRTAGRQAAAPAQAPAQAPRESVPFPSFGG